MARWRCVEMRPGAVLVARVALLSVAARAVVGVCRAATASGTIAKFWRGFLAFCLLFELCNADAYAKSQQVACFCITFAAEEVTASHSGVAVAAAYIALRCSESTPARAII